MRSIDLNCDLGEGAGHDAELMPLISSANVACGAHAGDDATMRATAELARRHGVSIGAHPGFADRENFGRVEMVLSSKELFELVTDQVRALASIADVRHVKPHGALYNLAARDAGVAQAIVDAVSAIDRSLVVYALAGSELVRVARAGGLQVAEEIFGDRSYQRDGSLTPRSRPDALIEDETASIRQVLRMIREGKVRATDGTDVPIVADTLCLHGDGAHAVELARRLNEELRAAGIEIKPVDRR